MVPGSQRRSPRGLTAALAALTLSAACASSPAPESADAMTPLSPLITTTVPPITTTTTTNRSTTSSPALIPGPLPDIGLEILVPEGEGPFPATVLVHGGGWVGGSPSLMRDLARFLTGEGYLTVNASYTLSNGIAGYPIAVDDVACAVRYAAAHPDGDGTVALIGHSSGAHLAALVALDSGIYGESCPLPDPVSPGRLIGLAGPYDVARLGPFMLPFFGAGPDEDPAIWAAGNPLLRATNNPALSALLMHGENDGLVDLRFASDFAEALSAAGSEVLVEVVEGARHNDMHDPELVGDLIVTWLERGG